MVDMGSARKPIGGDLDMHCGGTGFKSQPWLSSSVVCIFGFGNRAWQKHPTRFCCNSTAWCTLLPQEPHYLLVYPGSQLIPVLAPSFGPRPQLIQHCCRTRLHMLGLRVLQCFYCLANIPNCYLPLCHFCNNLMITIIITIMIRRLVITIIIVT